MCVGATDPGSAGSDQGDSQQPAHGDGGGPTPALKQGCNARKLSPQPPAGSELWQGHSPDDGAVYIRPCPMAGGDRANEVILGGAFWAGDPPPAVDPAVLAQQAVDKMQLTGPDIVSPRAAGRWTVGVPVWMHVGKSPTTFGPTSASASAGAVTVTATAKVKTIKWSMGDGETVTCAGAGTAYRKAYGNRNSPDCGHTYARTSASEPGEKYTVTATATWSVEWTGGGQSGELTEVRDSQVDVPVGELQALG
ncbi:ATP/GTP-binding protein [Streptomyces sp. BRA346]|uniref:ATP/GTP-binding protein n=1 Tax=Streptomyces sp. BRA346 TaxID=2878199 RepID=UPI0040633A0F